MLNHALSPHSLQAIVDAIEIGLIAVDSQLSVLCWNRWIARHTDIPLDTAEGALLLDLLPEAAGTRLEQAVRQTISTGLPTLLSPALHGALLPLYRTPEDRQKNFRMHQLLHVVPIREDERVACLIQITDVSANISRERQLRLQAEQLQRASTEDPLTRLANRAQFEKQLQHQFTRAQGNHRPLTLVFADLDNLSEFNATHDAAQSEMLFAALGECFKKMIRPLGDLAARYGDDRFAFLLPAVDSVDALEFTRCLFQEARQVLASAGGPGVVFGAATMTPTPQSEISTLVSACDVAVFQAKHEGSNRAVHFDTDSGNFQSCD